MARIGETLVLLLGIVARLTAITLPENYDANSRPNEGGVADVVNVAAELLSIRNVDEASSEMTVDISLQTSWFDSRLSEAVIKETLFVEVPSIWIPNIQIVNSHPTTATTEVLTLTTSGLVKYSQKLVARISCPISLAKYPFDRQLCKLQLNSYGYTSVHLLLVWHGTLNSDVPVYHPQFSFSFAEQTSESIKTPQGEYSNLYLEIGVTRCPLRVIFRAMLPSLMLMILSYYVTFCRCTLVRNKATQNGNHVEATATTSSALPPLTMHFLPGFSLLVIAVNGMTFIVTVFVAQINFIESPKASAVSGLDVWLNVILAILFVILWHSIQTFINECHQNSDSDMKFQKDGCPVNKTTSVLKIGIPAVFIVFFVLYCGIYLS